MVSRAALAVVAALALLALSPASAAVFSEAGAGGPNESGKAVRLSSGSADGKALGFTLDASQTVHIYAGTMRSLTPLSGPCGVITGADGSQSAALTWSLRPASGVQSRGDARAAAVHGPGYDCSYSGTLAAGAYAAKASGRASRGPRADGAGAGAFSAATITGSIHDARLTFRNMDAQSANVSVAPLLSAGATAVPLDVKIYKMLEKSHADPRGGPAKISLRKQAVIKTAIEDPKLASVPLEAGALYEVFVRPSTSTLAGSPAPAPDASSAVPSPRPDVVLTVTASDQPSPWAVSPSTGAASGQTPPGGLGNGG